MIFAYSESNLIVHEESSKQGIGNPNLLCEVVPNLKKVAAIPDNAVFMLKWLLLRICAEITLHKNVFPVPQGASIMKSLPSSLSINGFNVAQILSCSIFNLSMFSSKKVLASGSTSPAL